MKGGCGCKMKGMALGGVAGAFARIGREVAARGGARQLAIAGAKKIGTDQAKVQAQRGIFGGVQAIQDRNIAKIAKKRILFRDDYSNLMDAARDRGDMKEYFRLARLADAARDRGQNPIRRGGKKGMIAGAERFRILPVPHTSIPQASAAKQGFLAVYRM